MSGVINTWSGINACHAHLRSRSEEAARRRAAWVAPTHIDQADDGCDFDFLEHGAAVPKPEIH